VIAVLSLPKKLSIGALSCELPLADTDCTKPSSFKSCVKDVDRYWLP